MAYTVLVVTIMSLHVYMYICMHANKMSQGLGHRTSPLVNKLSAEVITSMLAALTYCRRADVGSGCCSPHDCEEGNRQATFVGV